MIYFVGGILSGSFVGVMYCFLCLLGEIFYPVYNGKERVGIIIFTTTIISAWICGATWLLTSIK